mmetsp:Transcript_40309/g.120557  ORF Transcript_40309/g.120557 Transcript_40309/m.120557 type:complete len:225 (+) Transcript_40309:1637-2311(+)
MAGHVRRYRLGHLGVAADARGGHRDGHDVRRLHCLCPAGTHERRDRGVRADRLAEREGRGGRLPCRPGAQALQAARWRGRVHDFVAANPGAVERPVGGCGVEVDKRHAHGGRVPVQSAGHRGGGGGVLPGVPQRLPSTARAEQVHGRAHGHAGGEERPAGLGGGPGAQGGVRGLRAQEAGGPGRDRAWQFRRLGAALYEHGPRREFEPPAPGEDKQHREAPRLI